MRRIMTIVAAILPVLAFAMRPAHAGTESYIVSDSVSVNVPGGFSRPLEWQIGAEVFAGHVPSTNGYLGGENPDHKIVNTTTDIELRAGFGFDPDTREGRLYKGLYQGIGAGVNLFMPGNLLGNPAALYVYQGAPVATFGRGFSIGYEWKFGMAAGWRHVTDETEVNAAVSTSVTALMGLGMKLQWQAGDRLRLWAGVEARHYSNGNTSFPNSGVNALGGMVGMSYVLTPRSRHADMPERRISEEDGKGRWMWDIMAYGAYRKRVVNIGYEQEVCPGRFAVAGLQVSPMRRLNRWVAAGLSLDLQWDEGAGLEPYWIEDTYGENMKFERPPFGKQIKAGVSAHAELTAPIFHVNAGIGYDIVNPKGDKRFYQSLTLKTFVTRSVYLNVGYRLGNFRTPQNLMLGLGLRL